MAEIALTQGFVAEIDDGDYDWLSRFKWHVRGPATRRYAAGGASGRSHMHRLILGLSPDDNRVGDHIDGNGLNNRRANLRATTFAQNQLNRKIRPGRKHKGIYFNRTSKKWIASICLSGRRYYLGAFDDADSAASAYDGGALALHGEFACLNRPDASATVADIVVRQKVPVRPTAAMLVAGIQARGGLEPGEDLVRAIWAAMLTAAD